MIKIITQFIIFVFGYLLYIFYLYSTVVLVCYLQYLWGSGTVRYFSIGAMVLWSTR